MLKAVIHGKAGRVIGDQEQSVSWSSLFKAREDLLTSTIFERFYYLSDDIQLKLLNYWFEGHYGVVPTYFGELEGITYWPRYTHQHDLGSNQVEPDLIINFTECNIIIEVKPPAGGDQYLWQWRKEIESFIQSEDIQGKPLYFLAIGRINQVNAANWGNKLLKEFDELKGLAALKWDVVTEHIVNTLKKYIHVSKQDARILEDMLSGLSLYGLQISPFKWDDFIPNPFPEIKLTMHSNIIGSNNVPSTFTPKHSSFLLSEELYTSFPKLDLNKFKTQIKANQ